MEIACLEDGKSISLVLTITTDWWTLRNASRSCWPYTVVRIPEMIRKLSKSINRDLVAMSVTLFRRTSFHLCVEGQQAFQREIRNIYRKRDADQQS